MDEKAKLKEILLHLGITENAIRSFDLLNDSPIMIAAFIESWVEAGVHCP